MHLYKNEGDVVSGEGSGDSGRYISEDFWLGYGKPLGFA